MEESEIIWQCKNCSVEIDEPRVLPSAGEWYIGTFCRCGPYARWSKEYFPSVAAAKAAIESGEYESRCNDYWVFIDEDLRGHRPDWTEVEVFCLPERKFMKMRIPMTIPMLEAFQHANSARDRMEASAHLSLGEREFLITGYTPELWEKHIVLPAEEMALALGESETEN